MAPLRWIGAPSFRALILRRTFPELEKSVIDRSRQIYPRVAPGARYTTDKKCWLFPSGARIYFGHLEHEHDVHQYQGAEFSFVGFDELTHFSETQYTYLLSRARSAAGLPIRIRCATNPGGPGADWVMRRWGPWLDPTATPHAAPGEALWYRNGPDGPEWVPPGSPDALSRVFVPARVTDNPHLMRADPGYVQRLMGLDPVTRARLLEGDWLVRPAAGAYFKRAWVREWLDVAPAKVDARIRYWDLAAGGDYAVGCRYSRADPLWIVEDVVRLRGTPHQVRQAVYSTAASDGPSVRVVVERDPGQAGKDQEFSYVAARELQGYSVTFRPKRVDKVTAFAPFSSQAQAGLVAIVRGAWNGPFLDELESFPEGKNDDQADAVSGAHSVLTTPVVTARPARLVGTPRGGAWG